MIYLRIGILGISFGILLFGFILPWLWSAPSDLGCIAGFAIIFLMIWVFIEISYKIIGKGKSDEKNNS